MPCKSLRCRVVLCLMSGALFVAASRALAQDAAPAPPPGHSMQGEAFNEGPRQFAYLMPGMPDVHFPITTDSTEAQAFFNQGVGQYHGFWYFESERSFRQAAYLDPQAAMPYWGMALANVNNETRAKQFLELAVRRKDRASPREAAWIDALNNYYASTDLKQRRRDYVRALEALVQDYPDDVEAKALLVLQIWTNGGWMSPADQQTPIGSHQAVDALLDQLFAAAPLHPAHHFRIHLWDDEKPSRALSAAARCGPAGPGIAHLWHMPGHTYSNLQRYADAAWQQAASARVDHAYMIRDWVMPYRIHNYAHNNEWLSRNLRHLGRAEEALRMAQNLIELPRHPQHNPPTGGASHLGRQRLVEGLIQFERWEQLLALLDSVYLAPLPGQDEQLTRLRLLGLAHVHLGHGEAAAEQRTALEAQLEEARRTRYAAADAAEAQAKTEGKPADQQAQAMAAALQSHTPVIERIERLLAEQRGLAALYAGDAATALTELNKLKGHGEFRVELLSRWLLQAGDPAAAEELARQAVAGGPQEVAPLANLVFVLHAVGKLDEARTQFEALRWIASEADDGLVVWERLQPVALALGLPAQWRTAVAPPADLGERPAPDTLGPLYWSPRTAPSWALPDVAGQLVQSSDFAGQPVLMCFFLGYGCTHCVEQLQALSQRAEQFQAQGIRLVSVSSLPAEPIPASIQGVDATRIRALFDPQHEAFRSFRAYDDFEQAPLHGTILIDAQGRLRWQEIGFAPFMDLDFLLQESQRLLALP